MRVMLWQELLGLVEETEAVTAPLFPFGSPDVAREWGWS